MKNHNWNHDGVSWNLLFHLCQCSNWPRLINIFSLNKLVNLAFNVDLKEQPVTELSVNVYKQNTWYGKEHTCLINLWKKSIVLHSISVYHTHNFLFQGFDFVFKNFNMKSKYSHFIHVGCSQLIIALISIYKLMSSWEIIIPWPSNPNKNREFNLTTDG